MRFLVFEGIRPIYKSEISEAVLPGFDGEFSVMDFHQPLLYRLRKGIIKIFEEDKGEKKEKHLKIEDGLAKFYGNKLVVFVEKQ